MVILKDSNNYLFSNTVLKVNDSTVLTQQDVPRGAAPRFNFLYLVSMKEGPVNKMNHFYPGESVLYANTHGLPSFNDNGVESELIAQTLANSTYAGVYVVNLCDTNNKLANVVLSAKAMVEENVPVTNELGEPLYLTPDGVETTIPDGNTPIVKSVLHVKYHVEYLTDLASSIDNVTKINTLYTGVPDAEGYINYPLMSFYYDGRGSFGNTVKLSFDTIKSDYTTSVYYKLTVTDENKRIKYDTNMSFNTGSAEFFVPNVVNATVSNIASTQSYETSNFFKLLQQYAPANLSSLDIFRMTGDNIMIEADSLDIGAVDALTMMNGIEDVAVDYDTLAKRFFEGEIIVNITSLLAYRLNLIVDVRYSDDVKQSILKFLDDRIRTTKMVAVAGGEATFGAAILDAKENYIGTETNPNRGADVRLLPRCQQGLATSPYTLEQHLYPPTYFDTLSFINFMELNSSPYQAFAGKRCRWSGFIQGSITPAPEVLTTLTELSTARLNIVKQDMIANSLYLNEQWMATSNISDLTEYNNSLLLADMIYDTVYLIHENMFLANEDEDVANFKENVESGINTKYARHAAAITVEVYRKGTTGLEGRTNIINITVDFKDIAKYAEVNYAIVDN